MSATFLSNVYKRFFYFVHFCFTFFNVFYFHLNVYYIYGLRVIKSLISPLNSPQMVNFQPQILYLWKKSPPKKNSHRLKFRGQGSCASGFSAMCHYEASQASQLANAHIGLAVDRPIVVCAQRNTLTQTLYWLTRNSKRLKGKASAKCISLQPGHPIHQILSFFIHFFIANKCQNAA